MGKFILKQRSNAEFQFNLLSDNGQVVLTSEGYKTKQSCIEGILAVRKYSQNGANFYEFDAASGEYFFVLKAPNRETIGVSELYNSRQSRSNGIRSVVENGQSDVVEDLTK